MSIVLDGTGSITGLTSGAGIAAAALSGQVPDANAPSGSVIQVVSVKTAALSFSSTSVSFVTIGLSASITPSSATSKIFILATYKLDTQSSNMSVDSTVFRDATDLGLNFGHYAASAGYLATTVTLPILDSPATTSSVTYSVRAKVAAGAGTMSSAAPSTITLMEIAA